MDLDKDGFTAESGDCDDQNPLVHPEAQEQCDGIDNNCNQEIDEESRHNDPWYQDADGDGFGSAQVLFSCAQPTGFVSNHDDCDDSDPLIHPQAQETPLDIGQDNRCNGFAALEEYDFQHQVTLPLLEEKIFIDNFSFAGPTVFLFGANSVSRFSFGDQPIVYEQEQYSFPWIHALQTRGTELWYTQQTGNITYRTREYQTERELISFFPPNEMISIDEFIGDGTAYNAVAFDGDVTINYFSNEEIEVHYEALMILPGVIQDIAQVPDVNGDGYGDLWVSLESKHILFYGGLDTNSHSNWTLNNDSQIPCTTTKIIFWAEEPHVICQNEQLFRHPVEVNQMNASLSDATLMSDITVDSMTAIDDFILIQEQEEGNTHIITSWENNPTTFVLNQGNSDLFLSPQTEQHTYIMNALEKEGNLISYDTIRLLGPRE